MIYFLKSIGGGFGRVLGRFFCYLFIGLIIYFALNYLDFDIKSIIPKVNIGGILWGI